VKRVFFFLNEFEGESE